jgi:hypothetical protein
MHEKSISEDFPSLTSFGKKKAPVIQKKFAQEQKKDFGASLF